MKRDRFIRIFAFGSLALNAFPFKSVFGFYRGEFKIIDIPVRAHIRHGLLTLQSPATELPMPLTLLQKDVFYADGCSRGSADLSDIRIKWNDKFLSIKCMNGNIWVSEADDDHCEEMKDSSVVHISNDPDWLARIYRDGNHTLQMQGQELLIIPIDKHCMVNGRKVEVDKAHWSVTGEMINIVSPNHARILTIARKI